MRHFCSQGSFVLLLFLLITPAGAGPVPPTQATAMTVTESTRAKLLAYLARGDIAGAIALYEVHTGQQAPAWLRNLQVAYSAASQIPGKCQDVARTIHQAFTQLGQRPEYVAFRTERPIYMVFETTEGNQASVSRAGYHVAVRIGASIYDAYTGPLGMKFDDYLLRLQARIQISWEVVSTP
ncbi:hypothetical protein [Hyalangium minutum]|uniref:hypothetical protein n=1 Tax=Hyalangium minutum TaxID=394096 RepID=UPI0006944EDF|nr:hypothetical protein [Hyalangium minutum]